MNDNNIQITTITQQQQQPNDEEQEEEELNKETPVVKNLGDESTDKHGDETKTQYEERDEAVDHEKEALVEGLVDADNETTTTTTQTTENSKAEEEDKGVNSDKIQNSTEDDDNYFDNFDDDDSVDEGEAIGINEAMVIVLSQARVHGILARCRRREQFANNNDNPTEHERREKTSIIIQTCICGFLDRQPS